MAILFISFGFGIFSQLKNQDNPALYYSLTVYLGSFLTAASFLINFWNDEKKIYTARSLIDGLIIATLLPFFGWIIYQKTFVPPSTYNFMFPIIWIFFAMIGGLFIRSGFKKFREGRAVDKKLEIPDFLNKIMPFVFMLIFSLFFGLLTWMQEYDLILTIMVIIVLFLFFLLIYGIWIFFKWLTDKFF